jgi:hypothetical protein
MGTALGGSVADPQSVRLVVWITVSFKDRGAILPGGHAGKAFWFSTTTGRFVSSTYYYSQLPAWLERWNQKSPIETWRGGTWDLLLD